MNTAAYVVWGVPHRPGFGSRPTLSRWTLRVDRRRNAMSPPLPPTPARAARGR